MRERRPAQRRRSGLLGLGAGVGIVAGALPAQAGPDSWVTHRWSLNIGAVASYTFGAKGGFGLGLQVSRTSEHRDGWDDPFLGLGPFAQYELLFHPDHGRHRLVLGLLGSATPAPELGQRPGIAGELGLAGEVGAGGWSGGVHAAGLGSFAGGTIGLRGQFPGRSSAADAGVTLGAHMRFFEEYGAVIVGRPLRRGEHAIVPLVIRVDGGTSRLRPTAGLDAHQQELLRDRWLRTAQAEEASIPAFLELAADLAAVGAPAPLLAACERAARDEARHADICFALAGAYGEAGFAAAAPIVSGPDPSARAGTRAAELARLAAESFRDGCLGEGAAAAVAAASATGAGDGTLCAALATIAADEQRHADLAWTVLGWCRAQEPAAVDAALRSTLERSRDERPARTDAFPPLPRHGWPGSATEAAIASRVRIAAQARLARGLS